MDSHEQRSAADRLEFLADEFERQRPHLRAVAYRMLGSVAEAEDAVQDAWLRLARNAPTDGGDLRGWLTVVVSRICLDALRSRRARREDYAGTWLPEPLVSPVAPEDPARDVEAADSVGVALLVVLEALEPAERVAFVLHDVFGVPFDRIAGIVDRSPTAARQLASRARRRVRASAPGPDADLDVQRDVVDAFLAAARNGDFAGLLRVLAPDAVLRTDGGGVGPLARPAVAGAEAVARQVVASGSRFAGLARVVMVNGAIGAIVEPPGGMRIVAAFTVRGGRIAGIDLIADPAKVGTAANPTSDRAVP